MIQLSILSGTQEGMEKPVRRFPYQVGREAASDLRLEDDGVWDRHARLELRVPEGVWLESRPEAPTSVNGSLVNGLILRNGDLIELGSVKLRFWLSETVQHNQRMREFLTWGAVAALCALQVGLVYWMGS